MKKIVLLLVLVAVIMVPSAFAQVRLDMGFLVPYKLGAVIGAVDDSGDSTNEDIDVLSNFVFLVPELGVSYQFDAGPLKMGLGLRGYSLILETLLWPYAYAEMEVSRFVFNANVGGLGFLFFGLWNSVETGDIVIPDISVSFKLGETFRIGVGSMFFLSSSLDTDNLLYTIYLAGRFRFLF